MTTETAAEALALLDAFAEAMSSRDLEATMACMMPGPASVFVGSGLDEQRTGEAEIRAHFRRDFQQSEWLAMSWTRRNVVVQGSTVAVWGIGEIEAGVAAEPVRTRFRFTATLVRSAERLRIMQGHLSFPAPGQREGESWPSSLERVVGRIAAERLDRLAQGSPDGTITLLFTDIEDSSRQLEVLGDSAWLDIVRSHHRFAFECAEAHQGHVVKSLGDGFMIAFRLPVNGVECAIDLQSQLSGAAGGEALRVRMGLHTGGVVREGSDLFGRHVTQAARIASLASGGQILVSEPLRSRLEPSSRFHFANEREVRLKGLSGIHHVCEVRAAPALGTAPQRR